MTVYSSSFWELHLSIAGTPISIFTAQIAITGESAALGQLQLYCITGLYNHKCVLFHIFVFRVAHVTIAHTTHTFAPLATAIGFLAVVLHVLLLLLLLVHTDRTSHCVHSPKQ